MKPRAIVNMDRSLRLLDAAIQRMGHMCFDVEDSARDTRIVVNQLLAVREARAQLEQVRQSLSEASGRRWSAGLFSRARRRSADAHGEAAAKGAGSDQIADVPR